MGGEALTQAAADRAPAHARLVNYYGPTEVSIWATRRDCGVGARRSLDRLPSIGTPLPNVTCYVVDDVVGEAAPRLLPIGSFGELWLGGAQVARGYLRRADLTAAKFTPLPWAGTDPSGHGVVYRTGDRVRWTAAGELEFGGRLDLQVKLRGQRIELGEIEHALRNQVIALIT